MSLKAASRSTLLKRAASIAVLLLLWGVAAADKAPPSLSAAANAAEIEAFHSKDKPDHDLSALRIFNRVVLLIKDNYVDPKRIEPKKMLLSALDSVERQVAEIMVDGDEKSPKIKVTVNKVSKEFDVSGVDTFWRMSFALKEVFDFVNKNLSPSSREDTREIEYAAVNGMLSTLDPHSILLKPEYFKEMKLQTKGEFGGLGFVIQMKESNLTVVRVLKGTPAQKAGIKSKDVITRIGGESTVNMDLNEAVSRLRGKPGSDISITVQRPSWPASKPMSLTRAIINVESVEAKLLENDVGYVKLKGFQGNTARDMRAEIRRLKGLVQQKGTSRNMKGLVLDLRGNPGGLLDQAIQVANAFVGEGTIVTTVGYSDKLREVKKAHPDEADTELPVVVIVNAGSASASEIVAGALKNLNRAPIIGRQTFGKGSVQVLYDFPDESALKLTIAQYLTPGDVSIQEVGITPDVELIASRVTKDRVDVFAPKKSMGEADLDKHLGNPNGDGKTVQKREDLVRREKPMEELRFLFETPEKKAEAKVDKREKPDRDDYEMDDLEGEDPDTDEIVEDFQIKFARDLILAAPFAKRDQMLKAAKGFLGEREKQEEDKIDKAIERLGVDWTRADPKLAKSGKLVAEMKPAPAQRTAAGDTLTWTVTAANDGAAPFKRLRAWSESENPYLDRREFIFGNVNPGEKKAWTVSVKLPKEMVSRRDEVTLKFFDDQKDKLDDLKGEVSVVELPRPSFAYTWQIVDRCDKCNGDGVAQLGETVEMFLEVKNVGTGKAQDVVASLRNKADENISLSKGRVKIGELAPGQSKSGSFEFEVKPEFKGEAAALQLGIADEPMDEYVTEKLEVPVEARSEARSSPTVAAVKVSADGLLRAAAADKAPAIAEIKKGSVLPVEAKVGDWYRVKGGTGWVGYLLAKDCREAKPDPKAPALDPTPMRWEPKIELTVDAQNGGIVTDAERFTLTGVAENKEPLRDVYVYVNDQKVFYKSAGEEGGKQVKFSADFPLKVGNNTVLVVARENQELMSRRLVIIHRRSAELAQKSKRPDSGGSGAVPAAPVSPGAPAGQ